MKNVLKITIGLVLFTGLAVGFYGLIGARGASAQTGKESRSPLGFDGVDRHDAERMSFRTGFLDRVFMIDCSMVLE